MGDNFDIFSVHLLKRKTTTAAMRLGNHVGSTGKSE